MSQRIAARPDSGAGAALQRFRLAAVLYKPSEGTAVDAVLCGVAHELKAKSLKLAGAVQYNGPGGTSACADMHLEDLASGRRLLVSEDRGPLAKGCRLDSSALEEMAGIVCSSIADGIDLVIINKFSKSEADGAGLRQAIEAAVIAGIPVLVGLNATSRSAWEQFSDGQTAWLPPERNAILAWCESVLEPSL